MGPLNRSDLQIISYGSLFMNEIFFRFNKLPKDTLNHKKKQKILKVVLVFRIRVVTSCSARVLFLLEMAPPGSSVVSVLLMVLVNVLCLYPELGGCNNGRRVSVCSERLFSPVCLFESGLVSAWSLLQIIFQISNS